jgi:hypothetical protein
MLLALVTAQRTQTIHKLRLDNLQLKGSTATFRIIELIKQSRPGKSGFTVTLKASVCVELFETLHSSNTEAPCPEWCERTKKRFISFKKPFGAVSKATIPRWINNVMQQAGVDVSCFKPHSTMLN